MSFKSFGADYGFDSRAYVPARAVDGATSVNKFGRASNVVKDVLTTVFDSNIDYPFPSVLDGAVMTHIRQDADQAAMRGKQITIEGCLVNGVELTQEVFMDATLTSTLVPLDTPLFRVNSMFVSDDQTVDSPVRVVNAANTVVYATINVGEGTGNNQTMMAVFSVPAGKSLLLTQWHSHLSKAANKEPTAVQMSIWQTNTGLGYAPRVVHPLGGLSNFIHPFSPYKRIPEMSDVFVRAYVTGQNADISSGFDGYLIDN